MKIKDLPIISFFSKNDVFNTRARNLGITLLVMGVLGLLIASTTLIYLKLPNLLLFLSPCKYIGFNNALILLSVSMLFSISGSIIICKLEKNKKSDQLNESLNYTENSVIQESEKAKDWKELFNDSSRFLPQHDYDEFVTAFKTSALKQLEDPPKGRLILINYCGSRTFKLSYECLMYNSIYPVQKTDIILIIQDTASRPLNAGLYYNKDEAIGITYLLDENDSKLLKKGQFSENLKNVLQRRLENVPIVQGTRENFESLLIVESVQNLTFDCAKVPELDQS